MYHTLAPYFDDIFPHKEFATAFSDAVPVISQYLDQQEPVRILDLCCGTGRALGLFAGVAGARLYGVDANEVMLNSAQNSLADMNPKPQFCNKDVRNLSPSDFDVSNFDLVLMTGVSMLHFSNPDRHRILEFVAAVLRPGGLFVFDTLKSGTCFQAGTKEAVLKRSIIIDSRQVDIIYVRHYELDIAHQHCFVIKFHDDKDVQPVIEYDYLSFYPLTPDDARSEALGVGLVDFGVLPINYKPSTFLCMSKPRS
jgi:SAM-dependent methyltransferase